MLLEMTASIFSIEHLIAYLKDTDAETWATGVCATVDGKKCLLAHIYDYGGGDAETEQANSVCNWFEEVYATTFMFFNVNDGKDPNYPQDEAKDRCVAYLENLRDGKAPTTQDCFDEYKAVHLK